MEVQGAQRILLGISGVVFVGIGLWTLVDPVGALTDVGVAPTDARGQVELRAMYGGLQLGIAGFLAWCLADAQRTWTGLLASTCAIGGLGLVRVSTALVFAPPGALIWVLCGVELGGAALGVLALSRGGRPAT